MPKSPRAGWLRGLAEHIDQVSRGRYPIYLDYPPDPRPRYGWGSAAHAALHGLIEAGRQGYASLLSRLPAFAAGLRTIPCTAAEAGPGSPHWLNGYVEGLDAVALYAFPSLFGSLRYVEVGSGNSTRFVRRSIVEHDLPLRLTSIDPHPRADIDGLCDDLVRKPLEEVGDEVCDALRRNDILMVDGSHRCLQNSDATVLFLDVLPRLRAGVLVHLHDIYLPHDYPHDVRSRYYSEQYLLAVLLLADGGRRYEVVFPGFFAHIDPELRALAEGLWTTVGVPGPERARPSGFWLRVRD